MYDFILRPDGDGEPITVTAGSRDVLQFERTTKGATLSQLLVQPKMADLYKLAHLAARRTQVFPGSLQDLEAGWELEFTETEAVDPTNGEASPAT
ncbi:hypothetical protein [Micromonospora sp. RTGN7]|uniref:hypothetical protein n=1 Tax=Micromonospora sp. RTGN7 TaxID=3016526 RepID=UPI0029FED3D0|nr:hypothetical protein [Micromonospora sp. RTGN7]